MADDPMTEELLDWYRERLADNDSLELDHQQELLAEVDRLRAREAAALEIVRDVANLGKRPWANQDFIANFSEWCAWCGATHPDEHTNDCPVTKARALLAEE